MDKRILKSKKFLGPKIFGPKIVVQKYFGPEKILVQKKFGSKKFVSQKTLCPKMFVSKKTLGLKIFWSKKFWGPKIVWVLKKLECENYFESKNILFRKILDQITFGSNKILFFFGGGSKLWRLVGLTIWSLHTKSWPPTILGTLGKVFGGGWWWVVVRQWV